MKFAEIEAILSSRRDQLAIKVLALLRENKQGLTRARLVAIIYERGYTNPNADRVIRRAVKRLRDLGLVILSSTDRAGYRLAGKHETKIVRRYAEQQYRAAKSRMATASKVLKAYGLRGNLRMTLGG